MSKLPSLLLEAFRVGADKDVEAIACLLIDDGFDVETMRVLAAWPQVDHPWRKPRGECPDEGRPTAAAWRWLVAGLDLDFDELAKVAGVTRQVARAKIAMLLGNRLVLPDGSLPKPARGALQQHARRALGLKNPKQESKQRAKPDEEAN